MGKKILVVDDEENILKMLDIRLAASGYTIVSASTGEEALAKVRSEKPDIVILDVMMPPPNGFQVARTLKDSEEFKKIPIILLTARGTESDKFWGSESGAEEYLTKPYNAADLLAKIKRLLGD